MYCFTEEGEKLGVVSCIPKVGEEHMWGEELYVAIGYNNERGCKFGMVFKKIN